MSVSTAIQDHRTVGIYTENALQENNRCSCCERLKRLIQKFLLNKFYLPLNRLSESSPTPYQQWSHICHKCIMGELYGTDAASKEILEIKKHFRVQKVTQQIITRKKTIRVTSLVFDSKFMAPSKQKKEVLFVGGNQDLFSSITCISAGPFMLGWVKNQITMEEIGLKVRIFCWTNHVETGTDHSIENMQIEQRWQPHTVEELRGVFWDYFSSIEEKIEVVVTFSIGTFIFPPPPNKKLDNVKLVCLNRPIPSTEKVATAFFPGLGLDAIIRKILIYVTKYITLAAYPEKGLKEMLENNPKLRIFIQEARLDKFASGPLAWQDTDDLEAQGILQRDGYVGRSFESADSQHSLPTPCMVNVTNGTMKNRELNMCQDLVYAVLNITPPLKDSQLHQKQP